MVFKKIFGGEQKTEQELDTDDLIVLERYGEAEDRLRARLKQNPKDLHAHLRLADVYAATGQGAKAVEQFAFVADEYADDGFYDKAIALLAKALRLVPGDASLGERLQQLEEKKTLDHRRNLAIEGFLQALSGAAGATRSSNALIEAQQLWLHLADTRLVKRLGGDHLKRLFAAASVRRLPGRHLLVEEGDALEQLFIVVRGGVEAVLPQETSLTTLRAFGPGDVFGEASLLERRPWATTYRTTESSILLTLDRPGLESALLGNPDPRGLLDVLREQHQDRDVAKAVERLRAVS